MLCRSHSVSVLTLAVMELFVFIVFQLLMEVQSYSKRFMMFNIFLNNLCSYLDSSFDEVTLPRIFLHV